jgi:Fe2+ transport system protein B
MTGDDRDMPPGLVASRRTAPTSRTAGAGGSNGALPRDFWQSLQHELQHNSLVLYLLLVLLVIACGVAVGIIASTFA